MSKLPKTYVPEFHNENEIKKMNYNYFGNTKMLVSELSFGCGTFCSNYGKYSLEECKASILEALKKGINYIDTAPWYGHGLSEEILGKCLEGVPRNAYYLATKVGRYEKDPKKMFDFSAEKTRQSIDLSLKRCKVDYFDVIQVHDIEFAPSLDVVINETLPAVEEAVKAGKAKFIGITGYSVSVLADCLKRSDVKIDMVLSYSRLSMLNQTLKDYLPFFQLKNLGIVNAAVHCMGLLSSFGPQNWHPASDSIKEICAEAAAYCKEKNVEIGRLALYYALQNKGPHTVLVGMNTRELLETNLDVVFNGLKDHELEIYENVQMILSKLKTTDWEGVEIERYWQALKEIE